VKSDGFFRWNRCFQHLANRLKKRPEISHRNAFPLCQFSAQFLVRCEHFTKAHEGSQDRDVYLNGARTVEDARKHRYALLRESIRSKRRPPRPGFEVPDWNHKNGTSQHMLLAKLNQGIDNLLVKESPESAPLTVSDAVIQMRMGMMM
jgi:hypothetical protein